MLRKANGRGLEEPGTDYGSGLETMEAEQLLELIRQAKETLRERGVEPGAKEAEALVITKDYRIFLGRGRKKEIRMRPMSKAVFLLFLKHPEGIDLKLIGNYRAELGVFYGRLSRKGSREEIEQCLDRMLDAASREVNIAASRVSEALEGIVKPEQLSDFVIDGKRGGTKRIQLDRRLVQWL